MCVFYSRASRHQSVGVCRRRVSGTGGADSRGCPRACGGRHMLDNYIRLFMGFVGIERILLVSQLDKR